MNLSKSSSTIGKNTGLAFVSGMPRETTKTFRMPEDLAYCLKKYAVETRQTEKDILIDLISTHLKNAGAL
jgi:hypothetical protein